MEGLILGAICLYTHLPVYGWRGKTGKGKIVPVPFVKIDTTIIIPFDHTCTCIVCHHVTFLLNINNVQCT